MSEKEKKAKFEDEESTFGGAGNSDGSGKVKKSKFDDDKDPAHKN